MCQREQTTCCPSFPSRGDMSCFGGEDEAAKEQKRQSKIIDAQLKRDKDVYKATHRLLLLGNVHCVGSSLLRFNILHFHIWHRSAFTV